MKTRMGETLLLSVVLLVVVSGCGLLAAEEPTATPEVATVLAQPTPTTVLPPASTETAPPTPTETVPPPPPTATPTITSTPIDT